MLHGQLNRTHRPYRRPNRDGIALRSHALRACTATAVVVSLAACSSAGKDAHQAQPSVISAHTPTAVHPAPPRETAHPAPPRETIGATLARALRPVLPYDESLLSVAVLDLDGADRQIASYGDDQLFVTASIVKVNILAALLLQAQDEERELTAAQRRYAEAMIRTSDNDATHVLWRAIGRAEGLDAANERLGLSSTQGGFGARWGLTQTTARDQVHLLRAVFARGPAASSRSSAGLNQESRAYIRELMSEIVEDQDWGVSAAGSRWALKNGWLKRNTTGLWAINSIGQVRVEGRRYLVSVLSAGNATMEDGIELVERAARAAIGAARTQARPRPEE